MHLEAAVGDEAGALVELPRRVVGLAGFAAFEGHQARLEQLAVEDGFGVDAGTEKDALGAVRLQLGDRARVVVGVGVVLAQDEPLQVIEVRVQAVVAELAGEKIDKKSLAARFA